MGDDLLERLVQYDRESLLLDLGAATIVLASQGREDTSQSIDLQARISEKRREVSRSALIAVATETLRAISKNAFVLVCERGDDDLRKRLTDELRQGEVALATGLFAIMTGCGTPDVIALYASVILSKSMIQGTHKTVCTRWRELLDD